MNRACKALLGLLVLGGFTVVRAQGLMPVPVFQNVQVQVQTVFDPAAQLYTYNYTVTNPASNTGRLKAVLVDITRAPDGLFFGGFGFRIPVGAQSFSFDEFVSRFLAPLHPPAMVAVGQQVPIGWTGGIGARGFALFGAANSTSTVAPGQSLGGLALLSNGVPSIRQVQFVPVWVFLVDDHDNLSPGDEDQAAAIEDSLVVTTQTLGPVTVFPGSFSHWNQLRDDLNRAIQLGWVPSKTLANNLVSQLALARQAADASDGTTAKLRLQPILDLLAQATPTQIRQEGRDLVALNVQALIASTQDTPIPFEPRVTLTPTSASLPLGALYTLTASVINVGDPRNPPVPDFQMSFQIFEGPNAGQEQQGVVTGADGKVSFSYVGQGLGTDKISVFQTSEVPDQFGTAIVDWTGGPDLVIQLFIPPMINGTPGQSIPITEITGNTGTTPAGPSVTRYFLSNNPVPNPDFDRPLGERPVLALKPGESSQSGATTLQLPPDLAPGTYFLGACADADGVVPELNETNNCRPIQAVVALTPTGGNQPPDCSRAKPSVASLWPPNHKLVTVSFTGITDPDGDAVTVTVIKITQDEPVNGLGDGDTSPDGFGVGTRQAQLRAERSGTGNGRVYAIGLKAGDGKGGTCTTTVKVGVPHDQGQGSNPIDDGQNFDSTAP